eukprot:TRINITY_DN3171_c0_g2_i2.p1 TRINITY_DN3171_c0_g2~~TRINITY_DN3171_c0_g2_i2.p1  ORF type:complete len:337 (-),score=44.32 TRINITY_DN3171_c0_g2_i2:351-1361(-)
MDGDVIDIEKEDVEDLLIQRGFAVPGLKHGQGRCIQFDFRRIQAKFAQELLSGTIAINTEEQDFIFNREMFVGSIDILAYIRKNVQQVRLTVPIETLIAQLPQGVTPKNVLDDIERVMYFLKQRAVSPETTLGQLVRAWFSNNSVGIGLESRVISSIPASQIVSLYQALEDHLATDAVRYIPEAFKVPLPEELQATFKNILVMDFKDEQEECLMTGAKIFQIKAKDMRQVLRKFVFRFLCSTTGKVKGNYPIKLYLEDPRCTEWHARAVLYTGGNVYEAMSDFLPDEWIVEHVYSTLMFIEENFFFTSSESQSVGPSTSRQFRSSRSTRARKRFNA